MYYNDRIEKLLQSPCWIIDILPKQVAKDSPGQYFALEKYFLEGQRLAAIKQKHIDLILKLNCYYMVTAEGLGDNPAPDQLEAAMRKKSLCILSGESMILSEPDETYLTVYGPDEELLDLIRTLAAGEGLYVWKPPAESGSECEGEA